MRGFPISRKSNHSSTLLIVLVILFSLVAKGCSSTSESEREGQKEPSLKEFLAQYEKTFNPADYDADVNKVKQEAKQQHPTIESASIITPVAPETTAGFRVQVTFTQEIEQANLTRDELTAALSDEWVYVVYDAPYYKVRVGNYLDRTMANQMMKKLEKLGYKDVWVVPDNVIENPPPKPPEIFIEPERQPDQHR